MALLNSLPDDAYAKLADNVYIVTKNYLNASKRLALHDRLSQWTLALLSLGLIVLPLLTVTKIPLRYDQNIVDFAAISMAVAVLMFSLLIARNNYSVRSDRALRAGVELNELIREMRQFSKDAGKMKRYNAFNERYGDVLRRYENVDEIDYLKSKINITRDKPVPWIVRIEYWFLFAREFTIYSIAFGLEFGFIMLLLLSRT